MTAPCPTCGVACPVLVNCRFIQKPDIYECPEHGMHQGGVLTSVRRTCLAYDHKECPCCGDWCDEMIDDADLPDDAESNLCYNGRCTYAPIEAP